MHFSVQVLIHSAAPKPEVLPPSPMRQNLLKNPLHFSVQVLIRGAAPKPEVLGKLRVACMELLLATMSWKAFRREIQTLPI